MDGPENSFPVALPAVVGFRREPGTKEKLAALLEGDLEFRGEKGGYASHDLHAFAAKFPPQLPLAFIRGLTAPGEVVLDPMMGSGTTIVEAMLEGRKGIGFDLDPLALRLADAKTTPLAVGRLESAAQQALVAARDLLLTNQNVVSRWLADRFDKRTRDFIDFWFLPSTQLELMALVLAIQEISDAPVRRFLELVFSSIVVTKSGGVSRARDLAHSRPHRVENKVPRNALEQFAIRLRKNVASISQIGANGAPATPLAGDARFLPMADRVVDLVVTSPPYANAMDYMRAHKFSLIWLGYPVGDLSKRRAEYIGSERPGNGLASQGKQTGRPSAIVRRLAEIDSKKAAILRKYFDDMVLVLAEMYLLRPDGAAVVVVGSSIMRGIDLETHRCLADIADRVGFDVVGVARRALDRDKRMMPARFDRNAASTIEQRMHEEYVIGLYKAGVLR
ncbi:MAG: site-specific DNA-methyltransferase [Chloroflexi bacterium]|nr:site-specific DNA-methyltransferase [Chloroflexota bacterium]